MKNYVLGFLFDQSKSSVALLKKDHPSWQKGKLNGPGGAVNDDEIPIDAMEREFLEETGTRIEYSRWHYYAEMRFKTDIVLCFTATAIGTPFLRPKNEDGKYSEIPRWVRLNDLHKMNLVENVEMLVLLALLDFQPVILCKESQLTMPNPSSVPAEVIPQS